MCHFKRQRNVNDINLTALLIYYCFRATFTEQKNLFVVFKLSHYCYTAFGALLTILFGILISILTKPDAPSSRELLSPIIHFLLPKEINTIPNAEEYSTVHVTEYELKQR